MSLLLIIVWTTIFLAASTTLIIDNPLDDEEPDVDYCATGDVPNKCNLRSAWLLCQSEVAASAAAVVCRFDVLPTLRTLFMDTIAREELILTSGMQVEIYGSDAIVQPYAVAGGRFISSSGNENMFTSLAMYNTTFIGFNNSAFYLENTGYFLFHYATFLRNCGTDGGALYLVNTTGLFDECKFSENIADGFGGALAMTSSRNITIQNSNFTQNVAVSGGAIYIWDFVTDFMVQRSYFRENTAGSTNGYGGAIYLAAVEGTRNVSIEDCLFDHSSGFIGGAIYLGDVVDGLTILRSNFISNSAGYNGGAIYIRAYTYLKNALIQDCNFSLSFGYDGGAIYLGKVVDGLTILRSTFDSNTAFSDGYGGAIYIRANPYLKNALIEDCIFSFNSGDFGGAVYLGKVVDDLMILRSNFDSNTANSNGGAIYISAYTYLMNALIQDCNFSLSSSLGYNGGAIYLGDVVADLTIQRSNFVGNSANSNGGTIYISASTYLKNALIQDCSFSLSLGYNGGAIYLGDVVADLTILRSNFFNNAVGYQGGAVFISASTYLNNTLIEDCMFDRNTADVNGGAILVFDDIDGFSIVRSNFTNNVASTQIAGAIGLVGTKQLRNVFIESCNFRDNVGDGLNLYLAGENISIANSDFTRNLKSLFIGDGFKNIELKNINFEENSKALSIGSNNLFISVQNTTFIRNYGTSGGGIYMSSNNSDISLLNVTFIENIATDKGGGIYFDQLNSNIEILNCAFQGNTASFGGGIFMHRLNRYIAIAASSFVNNIASINGGGIAFNEDNMNILISDGETYASSAVAETIHPYTYGLAVGYSATFTVPGAASYWVVFDYRTSTWDLDVVCIYDSSVSRQLLWSNSGSKNWPGVDSPVLQVDSPSLYIELSNFSPGQYVEPKVPAFGFKATIYPVFQTTSKSPTRFENNYASDGGAAYFNYLQEFILISQCIVRYNYAESKAGGLYFENTNRFVSTSILDF
jgi:predicted outer membrane repeat protein